ncbi:MAG: hypothetical protein MHPDNHAH_00196 [Anaerolineales bacterium]|nr:hypothetical protein [Anaerolineales bacterium]WKZ47167.1 MAG: hypothetical protein QY306_15240 [Anaerolineales bacterium]
MKTFRPLFFAISFILIVGLACSPGGGGDTPAQPTQPPQQPPTQAPAPTQPPAQPQATNTEASAPEPPQSEFFTEEFDSDPGSNWVTDIIGPGADAHADSVVTNFDNSRFRIELPEDNLYFYYTYVAQDYEDVRIDLRADNRGVNSNNVSLTCRGSKDGWYEWSVGSDGLWYLYAVTDKFNLITNGGTNSLKQGKEVNEYTMICEGRKISMFVNGVELKLSPVTENKYGLRDGNVGFNISSLDVTPVIVEVDWFKISEP